MFPRTSKVQRPDAVEPIKRQPNPCSQPSPVGWSELSTSATSYHAPRETCTDPSARICCGFTSSAHPQAGAHPWTWCSPFLNCFTNSHFRMLPHCGQRRKSKPRVPLSVGISSSLLRVANVIGDSHSRSSTSSGRAGKSIWSKAAGSASSQQ